MLLMVILKKSVFALIVCTSLLCLFGHNSIFAQDLGILTGKVTSSKTKKDIKGVEVIIQGPEQIVKTNNKGNFSIDLPEGTYRLIFNHPEFMTKMVQSAKVEAGKKEHISIMMDPIYKMQKVVVSSTEMSGSLSALLEEERASPNVVNILSAEQMSRAGDSDIAQALRRVSGLTLVEDKFVYVRGMGERYSSVLLNGARLPSTDPNRRVIELDL